MKVAGVFLYIMADFIRVWKDFDINDISEHLLIVGDASGDCSKCRALGIDYSNAKFCPRCTTVFKYIASRRGEVGKIISKRSDLIFVDFEDYKRATDKIKAKKLFFSKDK
jgi:uncharacterized C2H2 Zn-finger protein